MGYTRPLFLYFRLFNTVDRIQMFDIKVFADDWNRTADLWYWKLPLYRLSNKHCPDRILLITYLTIYNYKVYPIALKICQS